MCGYDTNSTRPLQHSLQHMKVHAITRRSSITRANTPTLGANTSTLTL